MTRQRLLPLVLAACAYALALVQRPGQFVADTKVDLHVDPVEFFADVVAGWAPSGGPGQVQAGQYSGYLWPMLPFHAFGQLLGLEPWLVQRLWLGTLLAVAAWGVVRLLDALLDRPRGLSHLVAGALVVANPYVVVFANRTTITLLAYALLPWIMLCVHRGIRAPRSWWWAAILALLVASLGGGVNAAVAAWVLVAPAALIVYEVVWCAVPAGAVVRFMARALPLGLVASIWWLVPVAIQVGYGSDFLRFTESAGAIWSDTSMSESLRLMGFWVTYLGLGYGKSLQPAFDSSSAMLFSPVVVAAGFIVPALVTAGFAWTRRWRYGPFFVLLLLAGLLLMFTGFPQGVPLRRAIEGAYYHLELVQFLRTTYKSAPLVAVALACLGGVAAGELARRTAGRRAPRIVIAVACGALLVASSWPLFAGRAIDGSVAFDQVPPYWKRAAERVDRTLPRGTRALVMPAQVFPYYAWGFPQDAILPSLTDRPVALRGAIPYADLRAIDLLWGADALVQQRRVLPGQLDPMLRLLAAGQVLSASDDDRGRSGAIDPRAGRRQLLAGAPSLRGAPVRDGHVQRRSPGPDGRGQMVSVLPVTPEIVVDGSAPTLAGLAALDGLPVNRAIRYAADMDAARIRAAASRGATIVVGDSNRRRVFVASRPRQAVGPTLDAGDHIPSDAAVLDPFGQNSDAQTVAVLDGARSVRAPFSPAFSQFPEHRPYAAFDGDPATYWVADRNLNRDRHWIEIDLGRRQDVPVLSVVPQIETRTAVREVEVGGRLYRIGRGINRLPVGLRSVRSVRVRIARVKSYGFGLSGGSGALAEIRIPGVRVREHLRPPTLTERALRGSSLSHSPLTYVFERTTGDDPFRRGARQDPDAGAVTRGRSQEEALIGAAGDGERGIDRRITLPATRAFRADGWSSIDARAPDHVLDRVVGTQGPATYDSTGRRQGLPGSRASSAFDGESETAWVADRGPRRPALRWTTRRPLVVAGFSVLGSPRGATPSRVRVRADGRDLGISAVGRRGFVRLPRRVSARRFELTVERVRGRQDAVAIGELRVPGLTPARVPRGGRLELRCGAVSATVGGRRLTMRPVGTVAAFDRGRPLKSRACGPARRLKAGRADVLSHSSPMRADLLRLRSAAPDPLAPPAASGLVLDPGSESRGRRERARVAITRPSWLVLAESYNRGWKARCDGRDLGPSEPINGYANGWHVPAGCREVDFAFAPQRTMVAGFAVSAVGSLLMLGFVVVGMLRGNPGPLPRERLSSLSVAKVVPRAPRHAALVGLGAGIAGAPVFALRAGPVIALVVGVAVWRGVGVGRLAVTAAVLYGAVLPLIYTLSPPTDAGGFNSYYAREALGAHWVGVGVWVLVALAVSRAIPWPRGGGPAAAGEQRSEP